MKDVCLLERQDQKVIFLAGKVKIFGISEEVQGKGRLLG